MAFTPTRHKTLNPIAVPPYSSKHRAYSGGIDLAESNNGKEVVALLWATVHTSDGRTDISTSGNLRKCVYRGKVTNLGEKSRKTHSPAA